MATLKIKSLYESCWKLFGFQHEQLVAERDEFRAGIERHFGPEMASDIQRHVDISLGRLLACPDLPNPEIMILREFYELLALEEALEEIKRRIEANAILYDPGSLLPTLGMSWRQDVLPLIDGQTSPGYMPVKNVETFLAMVKNAEQRIPSEEGVEGSANDDYFRKWRRELIDFLVRAVKVGEPVWCDLLMLNHGWKSPFPAPLAHV